MCVSHPQIEGNPDAVFMHTLAGRSCQLDAARRAARSMRDPASSLHRCTAARPPRPTTRPKPHARPPYTHALPHPRPPSHSPTITSLPRLSFYVDVTAAFPELALYVVTRAENKFGQTDISSGVTSQDEYLRTVGALFCVYWLARIGIDGELGFSFGVDNDWTPRPIPTPGPRADRSRATWRKRRSSTRTATGGCSGRCNNPRNSANSAQFGAIRRRATGAMPPRCRRGSPAVAVNEERMLAMLALTAVRESWRLEPKGGARLSLPLSPPAPPSA